MRFLLYDKNFNKITAGWQGVTAAGNLAKEHLVQPQISIEQPGYIYITLYNRSNSASYVYFDDLNIVHTQSTIVAGADYYPFGLVMDGREITDEAYRYGYQGQYSEENETTGWNEFELRMYDARFGRWLSVDPYGEFDSPYLGMGNTPNMSVDPDGGCTGCKTIFLEEAITITASRLPSIASTIGNITGSVGRSLMRTAISSPLDHVHYNTKTQKTSVVTTDDNYDELYVDGKYVGNSGQGGWKTYAPDAQVFGEYSFGFYNAAYGSMLRNDNVFSRLYKNAPSQAAQGNLFKASISNRDPTILYATLATPVAIIGAGEVLGSIAAEESYTLFQLGRGKNFRIDFDWRNAIHYHRRAAGGIGRHRPWQVKPGDLGNFWKRF